MVGWHHQFNGHEFDQTLGDSEGQGSLACCSQWDGKELDSTQGQNNSSSKVPHPCRQNVSAVTFAVRASECEKLPWGFTVYPFPKESSVSKLAYSVQI